MKRHLSRVIYLAVLLAILTSSIGVALADPATIPAIDPPYIRYWSNLVMRVEWPAAPSVDVARYYCVYQYTVVKTGETRQVTLNPEGWNASNLLLTANWPSAAGVWGQLTATTGVCHAEYSYGGESQGIDTTLPFTMDLAVPDFVYLPITMKPMPKPEPPEAYMNGYGGSNRPFVWVANCAAYDRVQAWFSYPGSAWFEIQPESSCNFRPELPFLFGFAISVVGTKDGVQSDPVIGTLIVSYLDELGKTSILFQYPQVITQTITIVSDGLWAPYYVHCLRVWTNGYIYDNIPNPPKYGGRGGRLWTVPDGTSRIEQIFEPDPGGAIYAQAVGLTGGSVCPDAHDFTFWDQKATVEYHPTVGTQLIQAKGTGTITQTMKIGGGPVK